MEKKIDLDSCRICLRTAGSKSETFTRYTMKIGRANLTVAEMFNFTTGFAFEAADPPRICYKCRQELVTCYRFLQKCRDTERTLRTEWLVKDEDDSAVAADVKPEMLVTLKVEEQEPDEEEEYDNECFVDDGFVGKDETSSSDEVEESDDDADVKPLFKLGAGRKRRRVAAVQTLKCGEQGCDAKDFADVAALNEHWREQHAMVYCRLCFGFFHEAAMKAHTVEVHRKPFRKELALVACELCNAVVSQKVYVKHLRRDHRVKRSDRRRSFACELCPATHFSQLRLDLHLLAEHAKLACPTCALEVAPRALPHHMHSFHQVEAFTVPPIVDFERELREGLFLASDEYRAQAKRCGVCGAQVANNLKAHVSLFHRPVRTQCPECGAVFHTEREFQLHEKSHHRAQEHFVCFHCDGRISQKGHLLQHMRNVHGFCTKWFYCHICATKFSSKQRLKDHIARHTAKEKTFECPVCRKMFLTNKNLNNHKANLHSGRVLTCNICFKVLKSASTLRHHIKSHNPTKDYICPVCGAGYACNQNLRTHVSKIHPEYPLPPKGTVVSKSGLQQIFKSSTKREKYDLDNNQYVILPYKGLE